VLHQYSESAEGHFKALFQRIFFRLAEGTFKLVQGYPEQASSEDKALVDRLARAIARDGAA
jgi:hypothetical protein